MTYRYRHADLHQEQDTVPKGRFLLAVAALVVISAVTIFWAADMTMARIHDRRPSGYFPERWLGPRHPVARVREDLFQGEQETGLEARKRRELDSYAWVDPSRGLVRIPIVRAMELLVAGRRP